MRSYDDYIRTARAKHGERFSSAALAPQFIPYFSSGERIEVETIYSSESPGRAIGEEQIYVRRGTVGVTTGRSPRFLLMHRCSDVGSSDCLSDKDRVLRVIPRKRR